LHVGDPWLLLYRRATLSRSIRELDFRVGNLDDRKEFRNPCNGPLVFADAQGFVVHRLRANLEFAHQLVDALVTLAELLEILLGQPFAATSITY
jgi:hypothetical protein